jgi:hypothetical protein
MGCTFCRCVDKSLFDMWEDLVNLVSTIVRMMPWSGSLSQLESIPHNPYIMKLILRGCSCVYSCCLEIYYPSRVHFFL